MTTLVPYNYIWKINATHHNGVKVSAEISGRDRADAKQNFLNQHPGVYREVKATNTHKCLGK